jgi:hypothetical protein
MHTHHLLLAGAALASPAAAQMAFSIDWHGPTIGAPDSFGGVPITEGDILMPAAGFPGLGPLPAPGTLMTHGAAGLGLLPGCVGHPGGTPCHVELDALSTGLDAPMGPGGITPGALWFSVDEYATGLPAAVPPSVFSEAPFGDSAADAFANLGGLPPGPLPPGPSVGHVGVVDGDGLPSGSGFAYPGVGLVEPDLPVVGPVHPGDNLDAMDVMTAGAGVAVYYSLDTFWADPLTGVGHTSSAAVHGVTGGDVLFSPGPGVFGGVWAPAALLGLGIAGPDDLDALIITENGSGVFEPSLTPYDWLGGGTDMVLFSVRRGSPVIGMPDSFFGIPIEEGDLLTTPLPTAMGGVSPFPGLFLAAENLGLATVRSGAALADDLDGADHLFKPLRDCNGNGVEDGIDIGVGTSMDTNLNGVPDECEPVGTPFCFCAVAAPCGNVDPAAGCANSTGAGALLTGSVGSSVLLDDLVLTVTGLPASTFNLLFMGPTPFAPVPFGDGLRCVTGGLYRYPIAAATPGGTAVFTGIVTYANSTFPAAGSIVAASTWHFQDWYRDSAGPCGTTYNVSNALSVTFTP